MEQLIVHLIGDYLFQTAWMANYKAGAWKPAFIHALVYSLPFIILTQSWPALLCIFITHLFIDRFRLPKYWIWVREGCKGKITDTGFPEGVPPFISVWLFIITDNAFHIIINFLSIKYL